MKIDFLSEYMLSSARNAVANHFTLALPLAFVVVPIVTFAAPLCDGTFRPARVVCDLLRFIVLGTLCPPVAVMVLSSITPFGRSSLEWLYALMVRHVELGAMHFPLLCCVGLPMYILCLRIACFHLRST